MSRRRTGCGMTTRLKGWQAATQAGRARSVVIIRPLDRDLTGLTLFSPAPRSALVVCRSRPSPSTLTLTRPTRTLASIRAVRLLTSGDQSHPLPNRSSRRPSLVVARRLALRRPASYRRHRQGRALALLPSRQGHRLPKPYHPNLRPLRLHPPYLQRRLLPRRVRLRPHSKLDHPSSLLRPRHHTSSNRSSPAPSHHLPPSTILHLSHKPGHIRPPSLVSAAVPQKRSSKPNGSSNNKRVSAPPPLLRPPHPKQRWTMKPGPARCARSPTPPCSLRARCARRFALLPPPPPPPFHPDPSHKEEEVCSIDLRHRHLHYLRQGL